MTKSTARRKAKVLHKKKPKILIPRAVANEGFDRATVFMAVYDMLPDNLRAAFANNSPGTEKPYETFVNFFQNGGHRSKSPSEELRVWLEYLRDKDQIKSFKITKKPKGSIRSIVPTLSPTVSGMLLLLGECAECDSDKHWFRKHFFDECDCPRCTQFKQSNCSSNEKLRSFYKPDSRIR